MLSCFRHYTHVKAAQLICTELQAACTLRQRATLVRAGLAASTRRAAAHRSKAARVQATALKRHAPPAPLLTQMMTIGRTPRQAKESHSRASKCCSRGPRVAPSRKATQLVMLRAADREAQQVQRRSHRALILAQRRSQVTGSPPPAAQSCDKREDQTAGQAHTSSQGGLTGSEQGLRCLDITTETRLGRDHHTQRSRVAHAHAAAQRRNTHADELPTVASNSQHAPHRAQGHLSERSAQPGRLMAAAQKAELAHGRFYRASALLQKRDKLTGPSLATVEDVPAAAKLSLFSQPTQQQSLVQVALLRKACLALQLYLWCSTLIVSPGCISSCADIASAMIWLTQPLHRRSDEHHDVLSRQYCAHL